MLNKKKESLEELERRVKLETYELPTDQMTQEGVDVIEQSLPPLPHPDTHALPPAYAGPMPDPLAHYHGLQALLEIQASGLRARIDAGGWPVRLMDQDRPR